MADAGYLTIGKVVKRLQERYPDLSVSKVRYLEDEGLLNPSRTPGGYRLYSQADVKRLENILYLQKARFLPLSVIREELEKGPSGAATEVAGGASGAGLAAPDDPEIVEKLHPIERMPELADVSVGFVQQLSEVGLITLERSPHGRTLVDGRDLALIRACDRLRHFGIGPKNLRQYVQAARRESGMFEQALVPFVRRRDGSDPGDEARGQFVAAFGEMVGLTDQVRDELVRRQIRAKYPNFWQDGSADDGPAQA